MPLTMETSGPDPLERFADRLGRPPLVIHSRHISPRSPYLAEGEWWVDDLAAQRIGPVEHPDLATRGHGRLGRPEARRGVGVVARAHVLKVDQQEVEILEDRGTGPQALLGVAVEGEDGRARPGISAALSGDHVLPRISPNIGLQPHTADPPLVACLPSLEPVAARYDSSEALPAHEYRFPVSPTRVRVLWIIISVEVFPDPLGPRSVTNSPW